MCDSHPCDGMTAIWLINCAQLVFERNVKIPDGVGPYTALD